MKIEMLEPNPPNSNPFWHDSVSMGLYVCKNVAIMSIPFQDEYAKQIVVVNLVTGERLAITFPEVKAKDSLFATELKSDVELEEMLNSVETKSDGELYAQYSDSVNDPRDL